MDNTAVYLQFDFSATFLQLKCTQYKISCSNLADLKYSSLEY